MTEYEVEVLEFIKYVCTQFFDNDLETPLDIDIALIEYGVNVVELEEIYKSQYSP